MDAQKKHFRRRQCTPVSTGRSYTDRGFLHRVMAVLSGALMALAAAGSARADDFEQLMARAESSKSVSVLVTGWQAVTGDEPLPGDQSPDSWMAVTGDEFVKKLEMASDNVEVVRRYRKLPVMAMQLDAAALSAAKAQSASIQVWDDIELKPLLTESTRMIGADVAWRAGYTGEGMTLVVIDSGTASDHPFLSNKVFMEACFADKCPNGKRGMVGKGAARPTSGHGTHVAGIALGNPDSSGKLSGVGPGLGLIAINVFNTSGGANTSSILAALEFVLIVAEENPGSIGAVNMSLGSSRRQSGVCRHDIYDQFSRMFGKAGIPVVVASGNDGKPDAAAPVSFPACIDGFLSVGAVTKKGRIAPFSNSGPTLDFLAPGVEILSSIPSDPGQSGAYKQLQGTSMAAPHVAAAMALLKQTNPDRSVEELVLALKKSGQPLRDARTDVTAPVIDVGRAITLLNGGTKPPTTPPPKPAPDNGPPSKQAPARPTPPPEPEVPKEKEKGWNAITG